MYKIDFNDPIHVHFIGIGGISMSGLAEILLDRDFTVSGSDNTLSPLTKKLEDLGAHIVSPQAAENITDDTELVVYTAAIHPDNPEYTAANDRGIPMMSRAELLGQVMEHYDNSIAVAGTHGKTTTTAMVGDILLACDTDPTISIGGVFSSIGGNIHVGDSDRFVTEACEYTNSYHRFFPKYNIILNIEEDHMDFFKDLDDIRRSFHTFAANTKDDGYLIINGEISEPEEITAGLSCNIVTFGLDEKNNYHPADISHNDDGSTAFDIYRGDDLLVSVRLFVPGEHNIKNALAAIALADVMNIDMDVAADALARFRGADRRFQYKGEYKGARVYDDYAHHPTEIAASIAAARSLPHERLVVVFQPHTYTRTRAFLDDFARVLSEVDILVLCKVYAAREKDVYGVGSGDILELIQKKYKNETPREALYFNTFEEVENFLEKISSTGDLLITMGAGDVVKIAEDLTDR